MKSYLCSCLCIALFFLSGCATSRQYPVPPLPSSAKLIEASDNRVQNDYPIRLPKVSPSKGYPHNILVLSGGGMNGAYTAGVLKGWSATGNRPQFDIVTGISTGALIAPYAFLGTDYDATMEDSYMCIRSGNIYELRPPPSLLWTDSLASSEPLRRRIESQATPELLAKVAEAHAQGRRLYVGTTNLDTKKLVIWDMGAIASRKSPESTALFCKILLASSSVPGLLPPVPINIEIDGKTYTELHVDGGVAASVFLHPSMLGLVSLKDHPPNNVGPKCLRDYRRETVS